MGSRRKPRACRGIRLARRRRLEGGAEVWVAEESAHLTILDGGDDGCDDFEEITGKRKKDNPYPKTAPWPVLLAQVRVGEGL